MRGLSAPTSLANLEREGGQPRSGWGVGEVADTPCARCVSRHAPTDARYRRWYRRAIRTSLYHRQYAGVGGWLFAYRAVRPARRDMQIRRPPFLLFPALPSCVTFAPLWLAQSRVDLH